MSKPETISVEELDRLFDEGSDEIDQYFDWDNAYQPNLRPRRVNVDMPPHIVHKLDQEAKIRGVSRQALIKVWLADRLEQAELTKKQLQSTEHSPADVGALKTGTHKKQSSAKHAA